MIQGDNKINREDEQFEAARAEDIMFDKARAEESAERARSHKTRSMARYINRTENNPEEEEEEENSEGNRKQPATNPIRVSHVWEKEIVARARSEKKEGNGRVWNGDIEGTRILGRRIGKISGGE